MLRAIDRANACLAVQVPFAEVSIFRRGFAAALHSVAAAFDVTLGPETETRAIILVPDEAELHTVDAANRDRRIR
jgi:hypothetical protein